MIVEEDQRFKFLEKKIGVFVAVAIVGFFALFFFIGVDQDLFVQKYLLNFTVEKGTGFSRGMPVKLSGFRIGRINSISLNEAAKVDIEIQIGRKYQKWIKKDSVVKLVKEGLVGDNIIEISAGSRDSEVLKDGALITFEKTMGLEEVANDIADKVKPVLAEVKDIISYVNNPQGDIKQSLKNIRDLSAELNSTRTKVDTLLTNTSQQVVNLSADSAALLKTSRDNINAVGPILEKADRSLATIEQKLPHLLDKTLSTLEHLDTISRTVEKITVTAAPKISPIMSSAEDTLEGSDTVLEAVKNVWPLRNYVPVPNERPIVPGDSHE